VETRDEAVGERLKAFLGARDRFAALAGVELLEVSEGYGRARLLLSEHHLNGYGTAQGGAIFTLADLAFAAACNSHGTVAVGINVSISYLKAVASGVLTAEAREVAMSARLSSCTVHVTDDAGDLVAVFQGMAYRKPQPIPF
jgi:acyl-CoA thioesterase